MSKLLKRLSDPARSGVFRAPRVEDILEVTKGSPLKVFRAGLAGVSGKNALLERIARALAFPDWFGGNWDALEDCLSDLSWAPAAGYVLLFEDAAALPADERGILVDILGSVATAWQERGRPFFAVFVDAGMALPALYADRR